MVHLKIKCSRTVIAIVTGLDDIVRYWFLRRVQYVFDKPVLPATFDQSLYYDNINEIWKKAENAGDVGPDPARRPPGLSRRLSPLTKSLE